MRFLICPFFFSFTFFFFSLSFLVKRMPLFNVVLLILVIGPCDQLLACALDAHCPKRYIPGWLAELRIHSQQRKKDRGIIRCESFHFQIVRFSVCRRVAFDDYYVRYRLSLVKREKRPDVLSYCKALWTLNSRPIEYQHRVRFQSGLLILYHRPLIEILFRYASGIVVYFDRPITLQ